MLRVLYSGLLICCFLLPSSELRSQVTLRVRINSGSSTTTCTDSFFQGAPEPQWSIQVAGQGYDIYPRNGDCFNNTPRYQYQETFACEANLPSQLQICLRAFEDDGSLATCSASASCLVQTCQNITVPAFGSQTGTISVSGASSANVSYTISRSGSFYPGTSNDQICGSTYLGTLFSGDTIGNNALSLYGNHCASNSGDPNPWGNNNDQGVWFRFATGPDPSPTIEIDANSDPQNRGDDIDLQLALYSSSNNSCSGSLSLIREEYQGLGYVWDETMTVDCLEPSTTYYLLVDGESTAVINAHGQSGYFGIEVRDTGIKQVGDYICDAEDLGVVPDGGSISTPVASRSNSCCTSASDPTPSSWSSQNPGWFRFTAPSNGHVVIDAVSDLPHPIGTDAIDLQLALYGTNTGFCSGLREEKGSSYVSGSFDESLEITCLTPGEDYWIMVDGSATNQSGIFGLTVSDGGMVLHTNDDLCSAIHLGTVPDGGMLSDGVEYSNFCNNTELGESNTYAFNVNSTAWFSFNAPTSGGFKIDALSDPNGLGDDLDLQLAIYTSSDNTCSGTLTERRSSYNSSEKDETLVRGGIQSGRLVYLQVDGASTIPAEMEGWFTLSIEDDPAATSPLPIELLDFSASKRDLFVLLDWVTASEVSNAKFQVQRSQNGRDWVVIRELAGAGNSSTELSYSTIDDRPYQGVNYYRLKQIDHNGDYGLSKVIAVDMKEDGMLGMEVFPNPIRDHMTVLLNASYSKNAEVQVLDAQGAILHRENLRLEDGSGSSMIHIDSRFSRGVYLVRVLSDKGVAHSERVVVE